MPFHRSPFAGEALGSVVLARELVLVERDRKIRLTVVGAGLQLKFLHAGSGTKSKSNGI
jgi:hypothetical protein